MLPRRVHEWAADQFSFVQYPRIRQARRRPSGPGWIDKTFRLGLFFWLMALIFGNVLFWLFVVAVLWLT